MMKDKKRPDPPPGQGRVGRARHHHRHGWNIRNRHSAPAQRRRVTAAEFAARLQRAKQVGPGAWTALCPLHEADGGRHSPSLSIRDDPETDITLAHCHAGCVFAEVVRAAGFEPSQLMPPREEGWRAPRQVPREDDADLDLYCRLKSVARAFLGGTPEQKRRELIWIGQVMLAGPARLEKILGLDFSREAAIDYGESIAWFPVRLLYLAALELAGRSPFRSFPPCALAKEIERWRGPSPELLRFARLAVRFAQREANRRGDRRG